MATTAATGVARSAPRVGIGGRPRAVITLVAFIVLVAVAWEGAKFLGGTPWRALGAPPGSPVLWSPPFRWPFANDQNLPHVWTILYALGQPFQRSADQTLAEYLFGAALYTWREAALGFALGAAIGLG